MTIDRSMFVIKSSKNSASKLPRLDKKLMWAVKRGNFTLTKSLLDNCKVNINCADTDEMTCLDFAIKRNNISIVRLLLARNINVNPNRSEDKFTPLQFAIANGRRKAAKLLIEAGADLRARFKYMNAMLIAVAFSEVSLTREILYKYAYRADIYSCEVMSTAIEYRSSASVVKIVMAVVPTRPGYWGKYAHHYLRDALAEGNEIVVEHLLNEPGSDPLLIFPYGETTLHWAAQGLSDNPKMVSLLLERGVEIDAVMVDSNGDCMTALHFAVMQGKSNMVKELINYGADVNAKTASEGASPLHLAMEVCSAETIELLISCGADMLATTKSGQTVLHSACYHQSYDGIRVLLANEADPLVKDELGRTAFQMLTNLSSNSDSRGAKLMVRRLAAIALAEQRQIDDEDLRLIMQVPELRKYHDQCAAEIEQMRRVKIYEDFTLLQIQFAMSEDRLSKLLRNEDFLHSFHSKICKHYIPAYKLLILVKVSRAEQKMETRRAMEEQLLDIFIPHIPALVIDLVIDFLLN